MHRHFYIGLTCLFAIATTYARSQAIITSSDANTVQTIQLYDPYLTRYKNIEGSPYVLSETMKNGWIMDGNKRTTTQLRYNSQTGEVEYIQDKQVMTPKNPVSEFVIWGPDTLTFKKGFPAAGTWTANEFYQVLYDGRMTKLVKHIRSDIKKNTNPMENDFGKERFDTREEYYVWIANAQPPSENYFLKLADGQMKSVVASKKSLVAALPQQATRIDQYAAEQKVKLKSWSEVAGALRYLETL